jgi:hypothetical protein
VDTKRGDLRSITPVFHAVRSPKLDMNSDGFLRGNKNCCACVLNAEDSCGEVRNTYRGHRTNEKLSTGAAVRY